MPSPMLAGGPTEQLRNLALATDSLRHRHLSHLAAGVVLLDAQIAQILVPTFHIWLTFHPDRAPLTSFEIGALSASSVLGVHGDLVEDYRLHAERIGVEGLFAIATEARDLRNLERVRITHGPKAVALLLGIVGDLLETMRERGLFKIDGPLLDGNLAPIMRGMLSPGPLKSRMAQAGQ